MKENFLKLLGAVAAMSGQTVSALEGKLSPDASQEDFEKELTTILNSHTTKVAELKKNDFNDGFKKATREVLTDLEKDLKEKYGVDSSKKGLDLVNEIVEAKSVKPEQLSEEDVKKHPAYLSLEKDVEKKVKDATKDAEQKVADLEKSYQRKADFADLREQAIKEFEALKPILPETAEAKARRIKKFEEELERAVNFEKKGSDFLLLDKDGKRLEDAHGNPVPLNSFVKGVTDEMGFEYSVATDRSSTGNGQGANGNGTEPRKAGQFKEFKGVAPTSEAELYKLLTDEKVPYEQKAELQEYWDESQKK